MSFIYDLQTIKKVLAIFIVDQLCLPLSLLVLELPEGNLILASASPHDSRDFTSARLPQPLRSFFPPLNNS